MALHCRIATEDDLPAMREIMRLAIDELQAGFLTPEEVVASHAVMGLDTQLVSDRTYFIVAAANVTPSDALISELKDFVKATIAPYKYPRDIEFVDALPKTATGKLRRIELRHRAGEGQGS